MVIDIFSKKVYTHVLRNKCATEVTKTFLRRESETGKATDDGKDFF